MEILTILKVQELDLKQFKISCSQIKLEQIIKYLILNAVSNCCDWHSASELVLCDWMDNVALNQKDITSFMNWSSASDS
jgi:hypothetical protein